MTKSLEALVELMRETADAGEYASPAEIRTLIAALEQSESSRIYLLNLLADTEKALAGRTAELAASALCVKSDAMREVAPLCVKLPAREPDNGTDAQIDINAGFANRMLDKCAEAIRAAGGSVEGSD